MNRVLIVCIVSCAALVSFFPINVRAEGIGFNAGFDYSSNYFWRGIDWYGSNAGVFFPFLNVTPGNMGLTLSYLGEYPAELLGDGVDDDASKWQMNWYGADFGVSYTKTFAEAVTVTAKFWYFWYYKSEDITSDGKDFDDSYVSGSMGITVDAIPLKPTVIYNHDYLLDDYDGTREKGRDYYVQFQLKHAFALTGEASLTMLGNIGYYNYESYHHEKTAREKLKGISDVTVTADLAVTKGMVSIHGSLNYAYVPDEDFNKTAPGLSEANKHRWWSGFGASFTF